jgi:site-specific DNA-methyltransferase (adenine-specific)
MTRPYYEHAGITIYHGDCREILPSVSADAVWDDACIDPVVMASLICRPAIVWGGNYYALPASRCWLVWDKVQSFSSADAELAWTNLSDMPVRVFRLSRIDAYWNDARETKTHPSQKPLSLMRWCLSFIPRGVVLDPFMGSGTTLVACKSENRKAIGVDFNERYCEIAARRLAQEVLPFQEAI